MADTHQQLELLSPAKNKLYGIEAIKHGADAIYIGGPAFGARNAANNNVEDIAELVNYAHRFHAKVFVALNTIFHDSELDAVHKLVWQLYDAGTDALIIQDMGLLEMDLPPIQLHASTQTDIRTVEKAVFLDRIGFSQIVLAREMDLNTIHNVANETECNLEFFVHGALCVAFSGQCFISHAHTGRSANRGECSQACRLPYRLEDSQGRTLANDKHLLSMKDNDQSANLRALIDAGISSFKIEGRLKDITYLKNTTAHYRQLLDEILEDKPEYSRSSTGRSIFQFAPQPEKTFNRSATDYFVHGRGSDIGAFDTPKFAGEEIGLLTKIGKNFLEIQSTTALSNGDGLCFFDVHKALVGFRANRVDGSRIYPSEMPEDIRRGTTIFRNRDQAFMRLLEKESAERFIDVVLNFRETPNGFSLTATDEAGFGAYEHWVTEKQLAKDADKAVRTISEHLSKLGGTGFYCKKLEVELLSPWFLPASSLNSLRRSVISQLHQIRCDGYSKPTRRLPVDPPAIYPEVALSYLANVYNQKARHFYEKHGVKVIAKAYEANEELGEVSLMITKHCLRYSYGLCPKEAKDWEIKGIKAEPMTLINGNERLTLRFDCKACEMHVMGKIKKGRVIPLIPL